MNPETLLSTTLVLYIQGGLADVVDGGRSHSRDRSSSLRPAVNRPLEAVNPQLAKSVSTPHIPNNNENGGGGSGQQSTEEHSTSSSKSS